jgi:uncharacterized protein (TIGR03790 family)
VLRERIFVNLAILLTLSSNLPRLSAAHEPAKVLLVVNDSTPPEAGTGGMGASLFVAERYAAARGVPQSNIVHINAQISLGDPHLPASYTITLNNFMLEIERPIQTFLNKGKFKNIKYIVPTYGVPTHIENDSSGVASNLSVDSYLACMSACTINQVLVHNPVYNSDPLSTSANWNNATLRLPIYAVVRLDGPSALISAGLVDKAIAAERGITRDSGIGYFDFQHRTDPSDAYYPADQTMLAAYSLCVAAGMRCLLNDQSQTGSLILSAPQTLWAWGWYNSTVNDAYAFVPGAVGAQLTSYTANDIRNVGVTYGTWVPTWLQAGITATWGATGEPFTRFYANGNILLNHLWQGYTFGEAAYIATPALNWMMIFVGDPLYTAAFK